MANSDVRRLSSPATTLPAVRVALATAMVLVGLLAGPGLAHAGWAFPHEISVAEAYNRTYGTSYGTAGKAGLDALVADHGVAMQATWNTSSLAAIQVLVFDTSATHSLRLKVVGGPYVTLYDPGSWTPNSRGWLPDKGSGLIDLGAVLAAHGYDPNTTPFQLRLGSILLKPGNTYRVEGLRSGELMLGYNDGGLNAGDKDANEPVILALSPTAMDCDDGNPCTTDGWDPGKGCTHSPVTPAKGSLTVVSNGATLANGAPSVATWNQNKRWTAQIAGATWIWSEYLVSDPKHDTVVEFSRTFQIPAGASGLQGSVVVAADNSYSCELNGTVVGGDPTEMNYFNQNKDTWSLSSALQPGANVFRCEVRNWAQPWGNAYSNPAGLLYRMTLSWGTPVPCDDGIACTVAETCVGGTCEPGETLSCDDGNPCTTDACDASKGCVSTPADGASCDDGNACTTGDTCASGTCSPGAELACDDGNPCTTDFCNAYAGGCVSLPADGAPCDDGDACTAGDTCWTGSCTPGAPDPCDDGNDCTADTCDSGSGCAHLPLDSSPGALTIVSDPQTLAGGAPGVPTWNEHVFWTAQVPGATWIWTEYLVGDPVGETVAEFERSFTIPAGAVDLDGSLRIGADNSYLCTLNGTLVFEDDTEQNYFDENVDTWPLSGGLQPGLNVFRCTVRNWAQPGGSAYTNPAGLLYRIDADFEVRVACEDGSACTVADRCETGGCVSGEPLSCDDGNACTEDACDAATGCLSTPLSGSQCDDGDPCTAGDSCVWGSCHAGGPIDCDDSNACTTDFCDPVHGCRHVAAGALPCDDGSACTAGDTCKDGSCRPGDPVVCNDGNPCTTDSCDPDLGCGTEPEDGALCDDGNACTTGDLCIGGGCHGGAPVLCDDGNPCTADVCAPSVGCRHYPADGLSCNDGNACTTADTCGGGSCQGGAPPDCSDGNPCTHDACNPATGCLNPPADALPCDDGSACTAGDICWGGTCEPGASVACDDGNPCTHDACDPATGCVQTDADGLSCDDGSACTAGDTCKGGGCRPGAPVDCNDDNRCTEDACDAKLGCVNTPADGAPCEDDTACTVGDTCEGGACKPGAPLSCDDGNPCTKDRCDPAKGCVFDDDDGASCDDGNPCTLEDGCKDGACASRGTLECDDDNPCTDDSCDPDKGCVFENADGKPCSDGQVCTTADVCIDGQCVGEDVFVDDGCGAVSKVGVCDGHILRRCVQGQALEVDCRDLGMACGWDSGRMRGEGGFNCVEHDPEGICDDIPDAGLCVGDLLYWCEEDGVHSWDCASEDTICGWTGEFYCCHEPEHCVPMCQGKQCGDDGCGGTCGSCEDDHACTPNGTCLACEPTSLSEDGGDDGDKGDD